MLLGGCSSVRTGQKEAARSMHTADHDASVVERSPKAYFYGKVCFNSDDGLIWFTDHMTSMRMVLDYASAGRILRKSGHSSIKVDMLYVELTGRYVHSQSESEPHTLSIGKVLKTATEPIYGREFQLPGIYEYRMGVASPKYSGRYEEKYLLRLAPNYSYTLEHYAPKPSEPDLPDSSNGIWYMNSADGITLLEYSPSPGGEDRLSIDARSHSLTQVGKDEAVFRKVYLK